ENSFQDIINYSPAPAQLIDEETWDKYHSDINYLTIIRMLTNPMTVNEIHQKHHDTALQIMKKSWFPQKKSKRVKTPQRKKKTTIYRYLKELKEDGLVVEAGIRVKEGQSFNQILYSKTALYFCKNRLKMPDNWNGIVKSLILALQYYLQKQSYDFEEFYRLLTEINKAIGQSYYNVLGKMSDNSLNDIMYEMFDSEQLGTFIDTLELVEWFITLENREKIRDQLLACFK
ncbi:MAG: hypothetical protein ACFFC7_03480, partial [Candidatus Hermodarchaeota archaeon]